MLHNNNNNKKMIILVSVDFLWATIDLWYMSFPFVCYFCFALESIEEETTKTVMVIALRYSFTSFFMYFTCLFWAENVPYCTMYWNLLWLLWVVDHFYHVFYNQFTFYLKHEKFKVVIYFVAYTDRTQWESYGCKIYGRTIKSCHW